MTSILRVDNNMVQAGRENRETSVSPPQFSETGDHYVLSDNSKRMAVYQRPLHPTTAREVAEEYSPPVGAPVIEVETVEEINEVIGTLSEGEVALVYYSIPSCGSCVEYSAFYRSLAADLEGQIPFLHANNEAVAAEYGLDSFPSVLIFDRGGSIRKITFPYAILENIAEFDLTTETLLPLFQNRLEDQNPQVCISAIRVLLDIDELDDDKINKFTDILYDHLGHENRDISMQAASVLMQLINKWVHPAIYFDYEDEASLELAKQRWKWFEGNLNGLEELMNSSDPAERDAAMMVYMQFVPNLDYEEMLDRLANVERMLVDSDPQIRIDATNLLLKFNGSQTYSAIYNYESLPYLVETVNDSEARWTFERITEKIVEYMDSRWQEAVREAEEQGLPYISFTFVDREAGITLENAAEYVERLRPFIVHPDRNVRFTAMQLYSACANFLSFEEARTEVELLRSDYIGRSDLDIRRDSAQLYEGLAELLNVRNISAPAEAFEGDEFPQSARLGAAVLYMDLFDGFSYFMTESESRALKDMAADGSGDDSVRLMAERMCEFLELQAAE